MRRLLDTFALAAAIAGLAILVTFCAATADAHTDQDLQAEVARLEAALAATPGPAGLNYAHREALADLRRRHPCRQAAGTACAAPSRPAAAHQATTRPTGTPTAGVEQWRPLVAAHFGAYTDEALRVIACESGGNPAAYNPSGASGLFQVLASWADNFGTTPAGLFDPATNVRIARALFDDGASRGNRWAHWVCKP